MNSATSPSLAAIVIQLGLGAVVFQANSRRKSNQCFLLLSLVIATWLGTLYLTLSTRSAEAAEFYIREACAAGVLVFAVFNLLRLSIQKQNQSWRNILGESWLWLLLVFLIVCFCQTKFFLQGARFSYRPGGTTAVALPIYGRGSIVYVVYFVIAGLTVIINYARDVRRNTGGKQAELAFVLIGAAVLLGTLLLAFGLGFFIDRSRLVWFAPFRVVLFSLIIAYGIATRRIMEVGFFLRRAMSYLVLTAYLIVIYTLVWWLLKTAVEPVLEEARTVSHLAAALAVAFAMAPARGLSQRLADRLFINTRGLDFRATVSKAATILRSVSTLRDLLERFAITVAEALGTDRVLILLQRREIYSQQYPLVQSLRSQAVCELSESDPVIEYLTTHREPAVLDELYRVRATTELTRVIREMEELQTAVALGIFAREHLVGVMLLGRRLSGRIYGTEEQNALLVLCGQLAVAIDNAHLFTEVQNAKIYNDVLLQNLTTGVIAADADGQITVFNNEAEQITGLKSGDVLDHSIDDLPESLSTLLGETLRHGERQENRELILHMGENSVVARASSSRFHGQEGQMLGALMVLTDITALKKLELQIRRSDRLASLGTLSAGMAHEIKNPLVSIKTFAQLLPERYQDSDFRETFSTLIGHEIDRIDSLVNQLLSFARPAKPFLKPVHVHEILEKSLQLLGHRLYQKDIKLVRSSDATVDTIRADADQLEQVFLNFFINAMDAMKRGGELSVTTEIRTDDESLAAVAQKNGDTQEILRITIRDNGEGIRAEDLPHVFDPFFTTKDYGTGLGLSVVHGIIQEHGGQIEVESELTKGTAFHILLPLVHFDREAAAAA